MAKEKEIVGGKPDGKYHEVGKPIKTSVGQALDFAADAGMGMENADSKSFAIPFITLLQGQSPQCEAVKDGGVEGAKPGMFINSITNELMEDVEVVPCAFQRRFIRWAPRSQGGGYKGEYNPLEVETCRVPGCREIGGGYFMDMPDNVGSPFDKDGQPIYDHLADTRNHFVLMRTAAGGWQQALVSLGSTQIKKSRRWMSRIQGIELRDAAGKAYNPPSFSHIYLLKSVKEENAKGKWYGLDIDLVGPVADGELYAAAKKFHGAVAAGKVETAPPAADEAAGGHDEKF